MTVTQLVSLLRELTCHMGSHSATCHLPQVIFPSQLIEAGTRVSDLGGMRRLSLPNTYSLGGLITEVPPEDGHPSPY